MVRSLKAYIFAPYLRLFSIQFPALKTKQEWKFIETKEKMTSERASEQARGRGEENNSSNKTAITKGKAAYRKPSIAKKKSKNPKEEKKTPKSKNE